MYYSFVEDIPEQEIPAGQVQFSTIFKRKPSTEVKIANFFDRKRYLYFTKKFECKTKPMTL